MLREKFTSRCKIFTYSIFIFSCSLFGCSFKNFVFIFSICSSDPLSSNIIWTSGILSGGIKFTTDCKHSINSLSWLYTVMITLSFMHGSNLATYSVLFVSEISILASSSDFTFVREIFCCTFAANSVQIPSQYRFELSNMQSRFKICKCASPTISFWVANWRFIFSAVFIPSKRTCSRYWLFPTSNSSS